MRKQKHQNELEKEQLLIEDFEWGIREYGDVEVMADKVAEWMRNLAQTQDRAVLRTRLYDEHVQYWKQSGDNRVKWLVSYKSELATVETTIKEYERANQGHDNRPVKRGRRYTPCYSVCPTHP